MLVGLAHPCGYTSGPSPVVRYGHRSQCDEELEPGETLLWLPPAPRGSEPRCAEVGPERRVSSGRPGMWAPGTDAARSGTRASPTPLREHGRRPLECPLHLQLKRTLGGQGREAGAED